MLEILPEDRERFESYFQDRPIGLGIITGGPGFGKTTAIACAAYGMVRTLKHVYMSAPTHVACDNVAERLMAVSTRVCNRLQNDNHPRGPMDCRRLLVVRGYHFDIEVDAFNVLLENPHSNDPVALLNMPGRRRPRWEKNLSVAYWLLAILRSPAVPALDPLSPPKLFEVQRTIDKQPRLADLRGVARGYTAWDDYVHFKVEDNRIRGLLGLIINAADAICTTPSLSCKEPYNVWKQNASGVVIDEAGCMSRPDFYSVWGNCLLPCTIAGDSEQLPPSVNCLNDQISPGVYRNRHAPDARLSILEFLEGSGWPVFRMKKQLRMAKGLFNLSHSLIYPNVPFSYGPTCSIDRPQHRIGREMERFLLQRFCGLTPSSPGTINEAFIHCEGSICFTDPRTGSKGSPDQVRVALNLINDFVIEKGIAASEFVIISPYRANLATINRMLENFPALADGITCHTADSFQGKEGTIVVVIFGTTEATGPGFTKDARRLNVMMSRQKSFLLFVGDASVTGKLTHKEASQFDHYQKRKRGMSSGTNFLQVTRRENANADRADGRIARDSVLRAALLTMYRSGRIATVRMKDSDS